MELKVDFLETKIMKCNLELEQYKNLLKVYDISKDKDTELQTVIKDFKETQAYFEEQVHALKTPDGLCKQTWERIIDTVGTNIGPKGLIRKKVRSNLFIYVFLKISQDLIR